MRECGTDGRTDRLMGLFQLLQMPVVIYSITKAKCPMYFYDCQLYKVSISTTYTVYIFSEYIYYTYAIFGIGKYLLFQSASRLINRNKIYCKCCIHQGLIICMLNRPFWPSAIGYRLRRYLVYMCIRFILGWMVQG